MQSAASGPISTIKKAAAHRKKVFRRSLSYDTLPKMKNKSVICQPIDHLQNPVLVARFKVPVKYKNQHLVLVCLSFINFTSMLAMSIIAPFFPKEAAMKGMRESVNGLVFSTYAFVLMVLSPIMSYIIPQAGPKLVLILGVLICGVSNILFGLLDQVDDLTTFTWLCFVVRICEAVGGTAFGTSTYTILMQEFPDNVGTAFVSFRDNFVTIFNLFGSNSEHCRDICWTWT